MSKVSKKIISIVMSLSLALTMATGISAATGKNTLGKTNKSAIIITKVDSVAAAKKTTKKKSTKSKKTKQSTKTKQSSSVVTYKNCTAARNAGVAPLYKGDPGYSKKLDRDGDGVACER